MSWDPGRRTLPCLKAPPGHLGSSREPHKVLAYFMKFPCDIHIVFVTVFLLICLPWKQSFSIRSNFLPSLSGGHLTTSEDVFVGQDLGTGRVLLSSSGKTPGTLLNSAQDSPPWQRIIQSKMSIVPSLRNSVLKIRNSWKAGTMSTLSWYSRANSENVRQMEKRIEKMNKGISDSNYKPHTSMKQVWHSLAPGSYLTQSRPSVFIHPSNICRVPSIIQQVCEVLLYYKPSVCKRMSQSWLL